VNYSKLFDMPTVRQRYMLADGKCEACQVPVGDTYDAHHRKPRSLLTKDECENGKGTKIENCAILCRACHRKAHQGKLPAFILHAWEEIE